MRTIAVIAAGVLKELVRRKDLYLIGALLIIVITYSAYASFGGQTGFQRYFKEIGITLTYIFSVVIAVTFASRQIPQEVESKTIYPILAHPVTRMEFILGKFFGVWGISCLSFTVFYGIFIGSIIIHGDRATPGLLLLEGYILHAFLLSFFVALTILLSLFLSTAANTVIAIIIYFGTNWFGITLPGYILLPHPELFDIKEKIIHTRDIVPAWVLLFLICYAIMYTALFLGTTCLVFRRRDL
ncbi:MAG: ABC transporter permease subunit [Candidatus Omnitrophica bacterium]|nr:ABC transporter permease subunit [Candidatus Omnitrophota bacterium]